MRLDAAVVLTQQIEHYRNEYSQVEAEIQTAATQLLANRLLAKAFQSTNVLNSTHDQHAKLRSQIGELVSRRSALVQTLSALTSLQAQLGDEDMGQQIEALVDSIDQLTRTG